MSLRKAGSPVLLAAVAIALAAGVLTWDPVHASSPVGVIRGTLQQTMPMTSTMPGMTTGAMPMQHTMPDQQTAPHAMPMQPSAGQAGMGAMMANMAKMQSTMARMQRMMAGGMMTDSTPVTGTMPMAGMMAGNMGEMMDMMAEMQEMMAEMQGMMAGQMPGHQTQGQQMQGGMMAQMPMMGTVILIAPVPMAGMMQQAPGMGMMGQMPMMQGMNMGGMMGQMPMMQGIDMGDMMGQMPMMQGMKMGGMMGQGAAQSGAATAAPAAATSDTAQSGTLGAIDVKVTPPDLSNLQGETIDFGVELNATGADLGLDLAPLATLGIGEHEMEATAWEVEFDHGHHVKGTLKFPAHLSGAVDSAMLTVADPAGGPALTLTWPASSRN